MKAAEESSNKSKSPVGAFLGNHLTHSQVGTITSFPQKSQKSGPSSNFYAEETKIEYPA